ncbi:trypsin [Mycolicibacterium agri]|uniref:Trypsin n=1 Tax=Mycolicibacterium agri TaxID=36811 RepID=A0A2A7MXR3_MYCAG|nr:trypsin-like peptidase domain-containing protein [Mycolicibacterium agri]PEG36474.1 trypsin [Mycolicibacterium agri]GFG49544.1 hypothetical protein MAGR_09850 [Mycolicibacterium agri]
MRVRAVLASGLLALTVGCAGDPDPGTHPSGDSTAVSEQAVVEKTATPVPPDRRVGALFLGAGDLHTCSAGVLDSASENLILTAAHCVVEGIDTTFVAGFKDSADEPDIWKVDAVFLDPRWIDSQDPLADFAILRVSRDGGGSVRAEAGGGLGLGPSPKPGTAVEVTGYPMGVGGGPIGCRATTEITPEGFPSLPCEGLVGGTSGAPWVSGSTIIGLTGGPHGGGCDENLSFSPPFDDAVVALRNRAEAGGPGDTAPAVLDDDC